MELMLKLTPIGRALAKRGYDVALRHSPESEVGNTAVDLYLDAIVRSSPNENEQRFAHVAQCMAGETELTSSKGLVQSEGLATMLSIKRRQPLYSALLRLGGLASTSVWNCDFGDSASSRDAYRVAECALRGAIEIVAAPNLKAYTRVAQDIVASLQPGLVGMVAVQQAMAVAQDERSQRDARPLKPAPEGRLLAELGKRVLNTFLYDEVTSQIRNDQTFEYVAGIGRDILKAVIAHPEDAVQRSVAEAARKRVATIDDPYHGVAFLVGAFTALRADDRLSPEARMGTEDGNLSDGVLPYLCH